MADDAPGQADPRYAGASALRAALRDLLPDDVAMAADSIDGVDGRLLGIERDAVARAVPSRQREFAAGRTLARAALRRLGHCDGPIPRATDRRPDWPAGVVGAISHSRALCAAAVAADSAYVGIGLDLEPALPLDPDLRSFVGRPEEQALLAAPLSLPGGATDPGRLVFAIKEAVFKACYPATRRWFDLRDARVGIDAANRRFRASILAEGAAPGPSEVAGRWDLAGGHFVAVLCLARGAGPG